MEDQVKWWGMSLNLKLSNKEVEADVDHFFRNIPDISQSKITVWKASLLDLLHERPTQDTVSIVVKEERKLGDKKNTTAYFVDGKLRLLFLEWLFTHNRFKGYQNKDNVFESWKQNVWNDYALSVTAGNTQEIMTDQLKAKMLDRYHKLMNLTVDDFEAYFDKRFVRLGSNQICSKSFDEERNFPYNPLVCGPRSKTSSFLDEGDSFSKTPTLKTRSNTAPTLRKVKTEPTPVRKKAKTIMLPRMMTSFDLTNMQKNVIG